MAECALCGLPRVMMKCASCGKQVCHDHYDRTHALCAPCGERKGLRVRTGPHMFSF